MTINIGCASFQFARLFGRKIVTYRPYRPISSYLHQVLGLWAHFGYVRSENFHSPWKGEIIMRPLVLLFVLAFTVTAAFAQSEEEALARRLLNSQGCKACHRLDGEGGTAAPDLSKIGSRLTREQLHDALISPKKLHARMLIPDFRHLPQNELDALINFLGSRK
jgi:hypothetical protein